MVYLGNSNPKCNGGFGFTLKYERFQLITGFNFRIGNDIVNLARMNAESMLTNVNQSYATTWRWRKNGDETSIPRALNNSSFNSYNSLPSDRYVEKGDVALDDLVTKEHQLLIRKAFEKLGLNETITAYKEQCPPDVTFDEIRLISTLL